MRRTLVALLVLSASPALCGELRGRLAAEGKPTAGVTVSACPLETPLQAALREARREPAPKPLLSATSKADGSFALALPASAGLVRLGVEGGGVVPGLLAELADAAGEDLGELAVDAKSLPLAGRVVDPQGGPVVGATVTLRAGRRGPGSSLPVIATTGKDGAFRFDAAGRSGNRLRVESPGFATVELPELRGGSLRTPVKLAAGRSASGMVLLADGKTPAGGAAVRAEWGDLGTRFVETRPDGSFSLEGLPAGELRLLAEAGERGRGSASLGPGRTRIVLTSPARLAGRVIDTGSGAAVAGALLVARNERAEPFVTRSGPDGRYELKGLPPGTWSLDAEERRYVPWKRGGLGLAAPGTTVDVPLRPASSLAGRVLDEAGAPIENARLQLLPGDPGGVRNMMRAGRFSARGTHRSGRDGAFSMARLEPGSNFTLLVRHDEHEPRSLGGLTLPPGAAARPLTVVMRRGPVLSGVVEDEAGRPLPGVEVSLSQALGFQGGRAGMAAQFTVMSGPEALPRRVTGPDGRFELRGVAAGSYVLTASKPGHATARLEPVKLEDGTGEPLRITLLPGAAIRGVVRDGAGNGVAGWTVLASPPGAAGRGPRGPRLPEPTGADGFFEIEGLEAGQAYDVMALGESGPGPRKAGVVAPAEDLELQVATAGRIRGLVTDAETGKPVTGFTVTPRISEGGRGMQIRFRLGPGRGRGADQPLTVQAEDGRFELEEIAPGRWDVEVTAERFQKARIAGVEVKEGQTVEGVEVKLSRGGVIAGRVLDAGTGRPLPDAAVSGELAGSEDRPRFFSDEGETSTRSDAEGRYELAGLAPGTWLVSASHPDYSEGSAQVALKEQSASADVKLSAGSVLAGTVVDRGGQPVAGAAVVTGGEGRGFGGAAHGLSDESGRFRFERQNPGRYGVQASLRGENSPLVEVVLLAGQGREDVVLTLSAGATIRGQVSGLPGSAQAGVQVNANGSDGYFALTRTAADGSFELGGAPAGPVSLRASTGDFLSGSRTASTQVVIAPGQAEASVEIVFPPGFRVSGRVSRGGQPVAEAAVFARPANPGMASANGRSDGSGSYALEGLQEGAYTIAAAPQEGGPGVQRKVTLSGDLELDLEVPEGRLSGLVVEAGSRRPLADAAVEVENQSPGRFSRTNTTTDLTGRFTLDGLEPGPHRLVVRKPAFEGETREVDAGTAEEVLFELRRGEGLGLQARDGLFGTPLRSLWVRVLDGAGTNLFAGEVPLDSEGRGEVPSLRPGVYQLRAQAGGYAPISLPAVTAPSSGLVVSLTPGGSLEIQVGPETLARPQATARLLLPGGQPYVYSWFTPDGLIRLPQPVRRLENVAPGSYTLEVLGGAARPIEVREGGLTTVVLP